MSRFHGEVLSFANDMCDYINQDSESRQKNSMQFETKGDKDGSEEYAKYEICSEHQHSNLVLLKTSYKIDGKWKLGLTIEVLLIVAQMERIQWEFYIHSRRTWQRHLLGRLRFERAGHGSTENRSLSQPDHKTGRRKLSKLQVAQYPINPADIDLDARMETNAFKKGL